jgi:hypothetical protein
MKVRATHCKYGHSLADAYINRRGDRQCRKCNTRRARESYHQQADPPPLYVRPKPYEADATDPAVQLFRAELARKQEARITEVAAFREQLQRKISPGTQSLDAVVPFDGHQV